MKKEVIVLNCGSLFVKFVIIDVDIGEVGLFGIVEVLGNSDVSLFYKLNGKKEKCVLFEKVGYIEVLSVILEVIVSMGVKFIVIGYCVVYGGEKFK